ncbi:MAG: hypothetical protein ACRDUA_12325 [Micromonosporaceae bacterium]
MTMYKLSPEQARELARKFGAAEVDTGKLVTSMNADVEVMQGMISALTAGVKSLDAAGHRAMRFDNLWETEFRPGMQRIQESMADFTPVLTRMQKALEEAKLEMDSRATATEAIDRV